MDARRCTPLLLCLVACTAKRAPQPTPDATPPPPPVDARPPPKTMALSWTLSIEFGKENPKKGKYAYDPIERIERTVAFTLPEGPPSPDQEAVVELDLKSRNLRACLIVSRAVADPAMLEARVHGGWHGLVRGEGETNLLEERVELGETELRRNHFGGDWGWAYRKLETNKLDVLSTPPAGAIALPWQPAAKAQECVKRLPEVTFTDIGPKDYTSIERLP